MTRERYAVLVFEHETPLRGVRACGYDDDRQAALLYADRASGRLVSETVWHDLQALAASRSTATASEAEAAAELNGVIGASGEYRLVFSSARPA